MRLVADNADDLYYQVLERLLNHGQRVSPRGQLTYEVRGAYLELTHPLRALVTIRQRRLNYHFAVAEWWWIASGRSDVDFIQRYNVRIAAFSDDGENFAGAYGPRWRGQLGPVLERLRADGDTRQAVISLWRPELLLTSTKDTPCTLSLHYQLRDRRLECDAVMRSSDAWLGLPYDLHNFARLQAMIAGTLDVGLGPIRLYLASSHLYDRDREAALRVLHAKTNAFETCELYLSALPGVPDLALARHVAETRVSADLRSGPFQWRHVGEVLQHRFDPKTELSYANPYADALARVPR